MLVDHPVGHLHQADGDCTAGGAGGKDADEGRPHDATGEPVLHPHKMPDFLPGKPPLLHWDQGVSKN